MYAAVDLEIYIVRFLHVLGKLILYHIPNNNNSDLQCTGNMCR